MADPECRFCAAALTVTLIDLGAMPLANSYAPTAELARAEPRYPLHARVCVECLLVQVEEAVPASAIFSDYAYFSSYSDSWVEHGRKFAAWVTGQLDLGPQSQVIEVASNDGYLLKHFKAGGLRVLGVEPAANVAEVAAVAGIDTEVCFFGLSTARRLRDAGRQADLLVANNVWAHVPDLSDFTAGLKALLAPDGVLSIEVPHVLELISGVQFDTIYHEHYSYFSLLAAERVLEANGLRVADVHQLPTHGGSLRILAVHDGCKSPWKGEGRDRVRVRELEAGLAHLDAYMSFAGRAERCRTSLRAFLDDVRARSLTVGGYGAAAKGNTLLNYCSVNADDLPFVADRSPHKQGRYLPGTGVPVVSPDAAVEARPDYLLILPWNLSDEVMAAMPQVRKWGGRFLTAVPEVRIL